MTILYHMKDIKLSNRYNTDIRLHPFEGEPGDPRLTYSLEGDLDYMSVSYSGPDTLLCVDPSGGPLMQVGDDRWEGLPGYTLSAITETAGRFIFIFTR